MAKRNSPRRARTQERRVAMRATGPGSDAPPKKGAPAAVYPIATEATSPALAPAPINDRFPIVIGAQLSLSYLASVFRLATTGYRQQYVDLLNELLEQDPHLFSTLQKRILSVASGRIEIQSLKLPDGDANQAKADEARDLVSRKVARIPDLVQSLAALLWGIYYSLSASEIMWSRDSDGWHPERLQFVHSRRLAYPDYQSWDLRIWDQGQVYGWDTGWSSPTNKTLFGLRIADWPGKFIVFAPQLRGDYPTREGLGRQTSTWAALKRIGGRGGSDYLERFAKSIFDVSYSTKDDGKPREATDDDIEEAAKIAAAIGPGSGSYAVHADSIKIDLKSPDTGTPKLTWTEWIGLCDSQISKAVLGGTLGTEVGKGGGNRALGEVQERAEISLEQYDATCLGEALRRDLVTWIVRLNRPDLLAYVPIVHIHVDPDPDPKALAEVAKELTEMGLPVDGDDLAAKVGLKLVDNKTDDPRRTYRSDFADPFQVDPDLMSEEAKAAAEEQRATQEAYAQDFAPDQPTSEKGSGAKSGKSKKAPKSPPSQGAKTKAANLHLRAALLLTDRPDRAIATEVFDQLLDDYPRNALGWILAAHWSGPEDVPLDRIDFSSRASWRASHEPIDKYVEKIADGHLKPVILVKTPGNPKLVIVDGHHRTLACEALSRPVCAFVATVHVDHGPWDELHAAQKKGSSKSSRLSSRLPSRL